MLKRIVLLMALAMSLAAQEDLFFLEADPTPPSTITRIAVGGFDQSFSDGWGRWKGWIVEGTIYPVDQGPWHLSAVGLDRPEGKGTMLTAGKYLLLGQASSAYVGLSGGTNSDFLPRYRGDLDLRIDLALGWKLDIAGALSVFTEDQQVWMLQAGPAYQGDSWTLSARLQQLTYEPGGDTDTGGILNLRFGRSDFGVWHNLRLAAGRGIVDSTASGGSLTTTTTSQFSRFMRRSDRRVSGTTTWLSTSSSGSLPQERLASFSGHWPLTDRFALQAEVTWGEKVSTYRFWGGSVQGVVTF